MMRYGLKLPPYFKEYEDGKHRRYSLLFSVNGGAFAVAKLVSDPSASIVLGGMGLAQLATGMMLFTAVMVVDIFLFGRNLRSTLPCDPKDPASTTTELFGIPGQVVLLLLGLLLCGGWMLAIP
jgi:hypothetical protein